MANEKGTEDQTIVIQDEEGNELKFGPNEVKELMNKNSELNSKQVEAQVVFDEAAKYGITAQELLDQANISFTVAQDLMAKGIIDESGEVIVKDLKGTKNDPIIDDLFKTKEVAKKTSKPDLTEEFLSKINDKFSSLSKELEGLKATNKTLMENSIVDKVQKSNPDLSVDDITMIMQHAKMDRKKAFEQHIKDYKTQKANSTESIQREFAKSHGLDFDALAANALKEQSSEGGVAAFAKGKKISFKKGKDRMTPRQAIKEFYGS